MDRVFDYHYLYTVDDAGEDTDRIVVLNSSDLVCTRTGDELRDDIGAAPAFTLTQNIIPKAATTTTLGDSAMIDVGGLIGISKASPECKLDIRYESSTPDDAVEVLRLSYSTSGEAAAGIGPSIRFEAEDYYSTRNIVAEIAGVDESPTSGNSQGEIVFRVYDEAGAGLRETTRITYAGVLQNKSTVDVLYSGITLKLGADVGSLSTRTDATPKITQIGSAHYTNAEEPIGLICCNSTTSNSYIDIGGGLSSVNAATSVRIYTAANTTTTTGTAQLTINSTAATFAGLLDANNGADIEGNVDIAGTLDSHGAAHLYSTLQVDNRVDIVYGKTTDISLLIGCDESAATRTNNIDKYGTIALYHRTTGEEPMAIIEATSEVTSKIFYGGCNTGVGNATMAHYFRTAANNATVNGTDQLIITHGFVDVTGTFKLSTCANAGTDTDQFLVRDASGYTDCRTGAQVLSDITTATIYETSTNIGIGTASMSAKLDIEGTDTSPGLEVYGTQLMRFKYGPAGYNVTGAPILLRYTDSRSSSHGYGRGAFLMQFNARGNDNRDLSELWFFEVQGKYELPFVYQAHRIAGTGLVRAYECTNTSTNFLMEWLLSDVDTDNFNDSIEITVMEVSAGHSEGHYGTWATDVFANLTGGTELTRGGTGRAIFGSTSDHYLMGNTGVGTTSPSTYLDVNGNKIRIRTAKTPSSAGDTGSTGDICWDSSYVYTCVATNTWKRAAITTW